MTVSSTAAQVPAEMPTLSQKSMVLQMLTVCSGRRLPPVQSFGSRHTYVVLYRSKSSQVLPLLTQYILTAYGHSWDLKAML